MLYCAYYSVFCVFFFFKQKTAYEMRISDWSSDVCSSDLMDFEMIDDAGRILDDRSICGPQHRNDRAPDTRQDHVAIDIGCGKHQIGRASCRERVCQYV